MMGNGRNRGVRRVKIYSRVWQPSCWICPCPSVVDFFVIQVPHGNRQDSHFTLCRPVKTAASLCVYSVPRLA